MPLDTDPIVPSSSTTTTSQPPSTSKARDNHEIQEKYRKLKRRFFELEEKHKETSTELQRSGERNVRMREERDYLLERIMELEQQGLHASPGSSSIALPTSSALPRTLLSARARSSFEENLRKAFEEDENHDDDDDLLLPSRRTTSPAARREAEPGATTTRRSTRASSSKAPNSTNSTNSTSGPRARSKRPAEADDGALSPSGSKRHKSRPSTSSAGGMEDTVGGAGNHLVAGTTPEPPVLLGPLDAAMQEVAEEARRTRSREAGKARVQHDKSPTCTSPHHAPVLHNGDAMETDGARGEGTSPVADVEMQVASPVGGTAPGVPSPPTAGGSTPAMQTENERGSPPAVQQEQPSPAPPPPSIETVSADPNIDPSLAQQQPQPATTPTPPATTQAQKEPSPSAPTAPAQQTPATAPPPPQQQQQPQQHPLSGNPYLSLSTIMMPKPGPPGAPTPTPTTAHPMFMNPYMYYPSPITPVTATPNTPSYYNPYFYLTGPPVIPGVPPPPMYPPHQPPPHQPGQQQQPPQPQPQQQAGGPNTPGAPPTPTSSTQTRPPQQPGPDGQMPRVKPKRLKAHTVTSKSYSIPVVPRDKNGKPMLPLNVGIMTVINLGTVCMREHFHTERYIFPVGYEVTRRYLSTINRNIEVVYHCTILDGGDGPKFQIVPSDTPDRPVIAGTATGAWSSIVKQANAIRNRQHSNSVSGPDFFGLGQNTIKHLIQELPNADRLRDYVWQNFIEGGPLGGRHAAVIPALPEEYDAALPRGAVYHSPLEREKRLREQQAAIQAAQAQGHPIPEGLAAAAAAGALPVSMGMGLVQGPNGMVLSTAVSPGELPKGLSHYPQHIIAQAAAMMDGQGQQGQGGQGGQPGQQQQGGQQGMLPPPPGVQQQQQQLGQQQHQQQASPPVEGQPQPPQQQQQQQQQQQPQENGQPVMSAPQGQPQPPPVQQQPQGVVLPNGVGGLQAQHHQQQPTPISPNTPAPSLASIMQAYQQNGNGSGGAPAVGAGSAGGAS